MGTQVGRVLWARLDAQPLPPEALVEEERVGELLIIVGAAVDIREPPATCPVGVSREQIPEDEDILTVLRGRCSGPVERTRAPALPLWVGGTEAR